MFVKAQHYVAGIWNVAMVSLLAFMLVAGPASQAVAAEPFAIQYFGLEYINPACDAPPC